MTQAKLYDKFLMLDDFINANYNKLSKEDYQYLCEILETIVQLIIND